MRKKKSHKTVKRCFVPDEVIVQEVTADCQGLEDVITDLSQELAVSRKRLWVGVTALVCAKLQQNCGEGGKTEKKQKESGKREKQTEGKK